MTTAGDQSSKLPNGAVSHRVGSSKFVALEHPRILDSVESAAESLGGHAKMEALIEDGGVPSATAQARYYLRPGHRWIKPLLSCNVPTGNLLLKVTVPRRKGLKRKRQRHAQELHEGEENERKDDPYAARSLLRTLKDNPDRYQVNVIGTIEHTHRFRSLPDFAFSSSGGPFMQKINEHILPFDVEKMKGFTFDMSQGVQSNAEIIPPPSFTHMTIPFNYGYRQNPGVKSMRDAQGKLVTDNVMKAPRILARPVPFDANEVPTAPPAGLPPESELEPALQELIRAVRQAMKERPIFTRRSLPNFVPAGLWSNAGQSNIKQLFQYVGYIVASGPWRDTVVKFGVDPRTDPKYRSYQTMMFMVDPEPKGASNTNEGRTSTPAKRRRRQQEMGTSSPSVLAESASPAPTRGASIAVDVDEDGAATTSSPARDSHLFDGRTLSRDGKVWQVCDITDPLLKSLLGTTDLREECEIESDGWYHNGLWAKVKVIMRWKITALLQSGSDNTPTTNDSNKRSRKQSNKDGGRAGHGLNDTGYARVAAALPDVMQRGGTDAASAAVGAALDGLTREERMLAAQIRTTSTLYRLQEANRRVRRDTYDGAQ